MLDDAESHNCCPGLVFEFVAAVDFTDLSIARRVACERVHERCRVSLLSNIGVVLTMSPA